MHPALLAVDGADLIEEAALLLFDLCEIIFLGQKLHTTGSRAHPVRTIWFRVSVDQLNGKGNGIPDGELGKSFPIVPIDLLLATITIFRRRQGDLFLPRLVDPVDNGSLSDAVVITTAEGEIDPALERRKQVSRG